MNPDGIWLPSLYCNGGKLLLYQQVDLSQENFFVLELYSVDYIQTLVADIILLLDVFSDQYGKTFLQV